MLSIAVILGNADTNNRRDGITGVLAFHRGQFLQLIEGHQHDVERLLKRLHTDRRHRIVNLLIREAVEDRAFAEWPMAYCAITNAMRDLIGDRRMMNLSLADAEVILSMSPVPVTRAA